MRTLNEIIEKHVSDDGIDTEAIVAEATEEMGTPPAVDGQTALLMLDNHVEWGLKYLAGLVLTTADQLGALPDGFEPNFEKFEAALAFNQFSQIYRLKYAQSQPKLVVPN